MASSTCPHCGKTFEHEDNAPEFQKYFGDHIITCTGKIEQLEKRIAPNQPPVVTFQNHGGTHHNHDQSDAGFLD